MSDSSTLVSFAQILLHDEEFRQSYRYSISKYGLNRRNDIKRALEAHGYNTEKEDREQLRRYFDKLWRLPDAEYGNENADLTDAYNTVYFELTGMGQVPYRDALNSINPINPTAPITMNNAATSTPITVTTQVLINGRLASQYSDADLFQSIALQEKAIKELHGIENKPTSLVDEIIARNIGIQALVTYLDSRPKK